MFSDFAMIPIQCLKFEVPKVPKIIGTFLIR